MLDGVIPSHSDDFDVFTGVKVDVLNVLGAGDAFMSGFLRGWLRDESHQKSCSYANACGALVVSRHGCAPAIPSAEELDYFIANADQIPRPDRDEELNYLHRVTTRFVPEWKEVCGLAFDHRKQFREMAQECGADPEQIHQLKTLLIKAVESASERAGLNGSVGVLIDDTFGQDALNAATGRGWWIGRPVELPASRPLELEGGRSIGDRLKSWPREHVVKCLVFYHPDDQSPLGLAQERQVKELFKACCMSGHELLLEVIPPQGSEVDDDFFASALRRFYNLDVRPDWWKLPTMSHSSWQKVSHVIESRSPHCRGVVMLGLDAPMTELKKGFDESAGINICKGFTVGRSLFSAPSREWLAGDIDDQSFIEAVASNYVELVETWRNRGKA